MGEEKWKILFYEEWREFWRVRNGYPTGGREQTLVGLNELSKGAR